jgi:hypothetical protein
MRGPCFTEEEPQAIPPDLNLQCSLSTFGIRAGNMHSGYTLFSHAAHQNYQSEGNVRSSLGFDWSLGKLVTRPRELVDHSQLPLNVAVSEEE